MSGIKRAFLSMAFIGYSPILPGTCGSLLSLGILIGLKNLLPDSAILIAIILAMLFVIVTAAARMIIPSVVPAKEPDQKWIVIDEFLGMLITLLPFFFLESFGTGFATIGFVLFRFFDMVKPLGIKMIDKRKTPLSVLADDMVAGVYALICLVVIFFIIDFFSPLTMGAEGVKLWITALGT